MSFVLEVCLSLWLYLVRSFFRYCIAFFIVSFFSLCIYSVSSFSRYVFLSAVLSLFLYLFRFVRFLSFLRSIVLYFVRYYRCISLCLPRFLFGRYLVRSRFRYVFSLF